MANLLPTEKWQQVLENVSPIDLCNLMMTSSYMNSVASWPELWKGMKVNMGKVRDNGLVQLYTIDRFKKIIKMNFSRIKFTHEELDRLLNDMPSTPLDNVDFSRVNMSGVSADKLARAVSHLHTVNLGGTNLTTDQCVKVLEASISSTTLVNVNLVYVNLSGVPSEILARAVSRLHTVNLGLTNLTTDQCVKLLEASISSTTLVNVDLGDVNLSRVPSDILARAVSRLHTVKLRYTKLTAYQCIKLLESIISSTTLVNVNLAGINLSGVPSDILAMAVSRLHTVKLWYTKLTADQCIKLLEASISSTTLENVNLAGINLSGVPAEILARAEANVPRLEKSSPIYLYKRSDLKL